MKRMLVALAAMASLVIGAPGAYAHDAFHDWTQTLVYSSSAVSKSQVTAYPSGCGNISGSSWVNVYDTTGYFLFSTPSSNGTFYKCPGQSQQFAYVHQPTSNRCYVGRFSYRDQHNVYHGPYSGAYLCN